MNVQDEISDKRNAKEFKGITFSKYKRTDVKKELLKCLIAGKIEHSCHWSAEFICAGLYAELWEIILQFTGKNIYLGNPKLPIYLQSRYENFKDILFGGYLDNELAMRNNIKIRKLFAELICILCLSRKKHPLSKISVDINDFNMANLSEKLKAKSVNYAQLFFTKEDPNDFFIAVNEFGYHLSNDSKNSAMACYWLEWIFEYEKILKKQKSKVICGRRSYAPVKENEQMDIVWIIWDILLYQATRRGSGHMKILKALLDVFCMRWTSGSKKRRRWLLYFGIMLVTDVYNTNTPLFTDKQKIDNIKNKINVVYRQIKKNEEKPATDYLFNNSFTDKAKNLEKTIAKLDKISQIGYIPRG